MAAILFRVAGLITGTHLLAATLFETSSDDVGDSFATKSSHSA